jgi:hypothetical protein
MLAWTPPGASARRTTLSASDVGLPDGVEDALPVIGLLKSVLPGDLVSIQGGGLRAGERGLTAPLGMSQGGGVA